VLKVVKWFVAPKSTQHVSTGPAAGGRNTFSVDRMWHSAVPDIDFPLACGSD